MAEIIFTLDLANTRKGDKTKRALDISADVEGKTGTVRLLEFSEEGGEVIVAKRKLSAQELIKMVAGPLANIPSPLKGRLGFD